MSIDLTGKAAVVTGAGRGIGAAIAKALAAAGARVVVNDIGVEVDGSSPSAGPAEEVVKGIIDAGGEAVVSTESVATMDGGRNIVGTAVDAFGSLDILACAAGIMRPATIFEMSEDDWDSVLTTNLKGHFTVLQPACVQMRKQQSGSIMTFSSSGGLEGNPNQPNYSATKEGILGLMRAVALSIAPYARCNAIVPSGRSRMTDHPKLATPGRQVPSPDHVAPLALYLASDTSAHITGQAIAIGGERLATFPQPRPSRISYRDGGWTAESVRAAFAGNNLVADELVRYRRYFPQG